MESKTLEGKTVLITGATQGIGLAAAKGIARHGPTLVLIGRDEVRTRAAVEQVKQASGNPDVTSLLADLSAMSEVRRVAKEFLAKHGALHVLVNNAGAVFAQREETADGYERTFALNHLSPFLLTELLRDALVQSAPARIITTSSGAHNGGHIVLDDLMRHRRAYRTFGAYCDSKLANILFTRELARRLVGTGVTANCFHPGFVASGFGQNRPGFWKAAIRIGWMFARNPEQGARSAVYLATSPDVANVTGEYFMDCKPSRTSAAARDEALGRALWEASEKLLAPVSSARVA